MSATYASACAHMTCNLRQILYVQCLESILFKPFNSQTSVPAFLTHHLKTCGSSPNKAARAAKCKASLALLCTPPAQGCGGFLSSLISPWAASLLFPHPAISLTSGALPCHYHAPALASRQNGKTEGKQEGAVLGALGWALQAQEVCVSSWSTVLLVNSSCY